MLDKKYKNVILGQSFFSFLLGLTLTSKSNNSGSNVLILDDNLTSHPKSWTNFLGQIEVNYLKLWGEKFQIKTLIEIEKYLRPSPYSICYLGKIVKLGRNPKENLIELFRKTSLLNDSFFFNKSKKFYNLDKDNVLDTENIDQECESYFNKIANVCFNSLDTVGVNINSINDFTPDVIHSLVNILLYVNNHYKSLISRKYEDINKDDFINYGDIKEMINFFLPIITKIQFVHGDTSLSPIQANYIISSLLCNHYEVNEKTLINELKLELLKSDGHFKKSKIKFWEIYRNKISGLLLDSYEGLVNFDTLHLSGHFDEVMPFNISMEYKLLSSIEISFKYDKDLTFFFDSKRYLFNLKKSYISDSSYVELTIHSKNHASFIFFFPDKVIKNNKRNFDIVKGPLFSLIKEFIPSLTKNLFNKSISFKNGNVNLIDSQNFTNKQNIHPRTGRKVSVLKNSLNTSFFMRKKLSSINYFGPLKVSNLGTLSFLMDLKYHIEVQKNEKFSTDR